MEDHEADFITRRIEKFGAVRWENWFATVMAVSGAGRDDTWAKIGDVSRWQGEIDWDVLKGFIDAVIIKFSQGNFEDSQSERNWTEAGARKIPRGVYHYFDPDYSSTVQAQTFIEKLAGRRPELGIFLDVEERPVNISEVLNWLVVVEAETGTRPRIYTGVSVWNELGGVGWANDYGLWIAQYPYEADNDGTITFDDWDEVPTGYAPTLPNDWLDWDVWQFSPTGDGLGMGAASHGFDLNFANGTLEEVFELMPEDNTKIEDLVARTNELLMSVIDILNVSNQRLKSINNRSGKILLVLEEIKELLAGAGGGSPDIELITLQAWPDEGRDSKANLWLFPKTRNGAGYYMPTKLDVDDREPFQIEKGVQVEAFKIAGEAGATFGGSPWPDTLVRVDGGQLFYILAIPVPKEFQTQFNVDFVWFGGRKRDFMEV